MGKIYKIGFFILLFLLAAGGAYYFGLNQIKPAPTLTPTPTKSILPTEEVTQSPQETPSPTSGKINDLDYVKENIRAAVDTKNYAALEGYMANNVSVILEATECCGSLSRADATKQLDYLKDATSPWNFDQSNDTIKKIKAQEPTKYGPDSAYVGIAANEYTVSFKFDASNKINGITMAVTYKLVLP